MGGNAFQAYETPRMTQEIYDDLKQQYCNKLASLFQHIIVPIEAPEKTTHGDIDILVSEPFADQIKSLTDCQIEPSRLSPERQMTIQGTAIKKLLNSCSMIADSSTINLLMPYEHEKNYYVQLDVNIQPNYARWKWLFFTHSHGDFVGLIGSSLRQVGLVATDKGFFARDVEIEPKDKKRCLVFLTDDPAEVCDFLRLDPKYWVPSQGHDLTSVSRFSSKEELFKAVVNTRFFSRDCYRDRDRTAGDKKKWALRKAYREFVEDFLPGYFDASSSPPISKEEQVELREKVFHDTLNHFNKHEEWRKMKSAWNQEQADFVTKRKFKEKRKFILAEDNRYADEWTRWCGYPIVGSEPQNPTKKAA